MEKKTMGSFMAALRKANGLTQQQVADKLMYQIKLSVNGNVMKVILKYLCYL